MKTRELIEKLTQMGLKFQGTEGNLMTFTKEPDIARFTIACDLEPNDEHGELTPDNWVYFWTQVAKYARTPLDERQDEPKYRVRLKGFNADTGKQYLTCSDKHGSMKNQNFFGCHLQKGLCQEFTTKELDTLLELAKDRNQQWLAMLLSDPDNRELVEKNND